MQLGALRRLEANVTGSAGEQPAAHLPTADNADPGAENKFHAGKWSVHSLYTHKSIHIYKKKCPKNKAKRTQLNREKAAIFLPRDPEALMDLK